ncbi:MAG: hypothetical protein IJT03_02985 [Clostridia bacterium]|nr:hypothetical protein [Clostridia bacterium]
MKKARELLIVFGLGGMIYGLLEVVFRGYTHWTMLLTGGFVFILLYFMNISLKSKSLLLRCFIACLMITSVEFCVGCIVNIALAMNVWDYSGLRFNLLGQICPVFSALWFLLSIPASLLSRSLEQRLRA